MKQAREAAHLSQSELARRARLSQPTIAGLESGSRAPSVRTAEDIAAALGVRFGWLSLGDGPAKIDSDMLLRSVLSNDQLSADEKRAVSDLWDIASRYAMGDAPILSAHERSVLAGYRRVAKSTREMIDKMLQVALAEKGIDWPTALSVGERRSHVIDEVFPLDEQYCYVQLLDAAAGMPLDAVPVDDNVPVPSEFAKGDGLAVVRALGDSMSGIIEDGEFVLVRGAKQSLNYKPGDVVLCRVDECEYTIKIYGWASGGRRHLFSANKRYDPLVVSSKHSAIEAVVVARKRRDGRWCKVTRQPVPEKK